MSLRLALTREAPATLRTSSSSAHRARTSLGPRAITYRLSLPSIHKNIHKRQIHIPNILLPPLIFTGLLLALYTWKSFVMISLQNKIIYNPYLPPSARLDKISDYRSRHHGIEWKEIHMRSIDGTDLALAVATVANVPSSSQDAEAVDGHVYILYCQGNASSLPPRLQDHSWILREIKRSFTSTYPGHRKIRFTQVGLSYRGYWTSAGKASEIGINYDTAAAVKWISQLHDNTYQKDKHGVHKTKPIFMIWGQSIGSGFATNLAAAGVIPAHLEPVALILETPFLSIKQMLRDLYPQKWLPYKYLHPFLRNFLDSYKNIGTIATARKRQGIESPKILIVQAGRDEIVPERHTEELERRCIEVGIPVETALIPKAFHNDAIAYGRGSIAKFIMEQTVIAMVGGAESSGFEPRMTDTSPPAADLAAGKL